MKKLRFKSTEDFMDYANEAKNTLIFSLLMPQITSMKESQDNWVECALDKCKKACSSAIFYNENYDFFGVKGDDIFLDNISAAFFNAAKESGFTFNNNIDSTTLARDFFQDTILMQCIMSSYDTIVQLMSSECSLTSYAFINKIQDKGYNELIKRGIITNSFNCFRNNGNNSGSHSSKATGFSKKMNTHCKILKQFDFLDSFYLEESLKASHSDLFYKLMNTDLRELKSVLKMYSDCDTYPKKVIKNNWEISKKFYKNLLPIDWKNSEEILNTKDITDYLYLAYKVENIFGLGLGSCIMQNVIQLKKNGNRYLDGVNDIRTIALISRLPNVFSRNLYFQFAIEALWGNVECKGTFFEDLLKPDAVAMQGTPSSFNITNWLLAYQKFCIFFSDFVFPIYEWYFLLTLTTTASEHKVENVLSTLQNLLSIYITKNHTKFAHEEFKNFKFMLPKEFDKKKVKEPFYLEENEETPHIASILSAFKSVTHDTKSPLLRLDRYFCINPNKNVLKHNYIMGQYITSIIQDNAHI